MASILSRPQWVKWSDRSYWQTKNIPNGEMNGWTDHYRDVIMSVIASQITGVSIVCSTVCSGADQRKHQSSAQRASDAKNVSIWWHHHVVPLPKGFDLRSSVKYVRLCTLGQMFLEFYLHHTGACVKFSNQGYSKGTPKFFWRWCVAPVFDRISLAKEILVENILLAKENFLIMSPFVWDFKEC